jgi:hypothetical protein
MRLLAGTTTAAFACVLITGIRVLPGPVSTLKVTGVASAIVATLFLGIVLIGQLNAPR